METFLSDLKHSDPTDLRALFGQIDIYLFDQLLRGRIRPGMSVLDAGCGVGRNLVYLLRTGHEVFAVDGDSYAVSVVRQLATALAPRLPESNFRVEAIEHMTFPERVADVVICNSVLHFARDDRQFGAMVDAIWRRVKPGGVLFCRLASTIGMADRMQHVAGRRFILPDGVEWYLVDEAILLDLTQRMGGTLLDPLKTTVVQNQRCMTTWVMGKPLEKS